MNDNEAFRAEFLKNSGVAETLIQMAESASIEMESERKIRNGYMAVVTSIANKLQKKYETGTASGDAEAKEEPTSISEYLKDAGEEWRAFVDGELKSSNENNNRTLGGSTTRPMDDDEDKDDSNYDVQMEKIMARFTNFNQILSQGSTDNEEEEEEAETVEEGKKDDDGDGDGGFDSDDEPLDDNEAGSKIEKVTIAEPEPLRDEFCDNNYWKVDNTDEIDTDSLLSELED